MSIVKLGVCLALSIFLWHLNTLLVVILVLMECLGSLMVLQLATRVVLRVDVSSMIFLKMAYSSLTVLKYSCLLVLLQISLSM